MFHMSIGLSYIAFLTAFGQSPNNNFSKECESLFSLNVKKIINSKVICTSRAQLIKQMIDVRTTYGIHKVHLLESFESADRTADIIHWEITYAKDNSTESIMTIVKYNEKGIIEEINEVYGEKEAYQWGA